MVRYRKGRHCRGLGGRRAYKPIGIPACELERAVLSIDEFEALRLCDLEGLQQAEAGTAMGISRGTVQRLLIRARATVVDALLNQKFLIVLDGYEHERANEEGETDEDCVSE